MSAMFQRCTSLLHISVSSSVRSPVHHSFLTLTKLLQWIGGVTFTGSIVAFLKLAGKMSSRPLILPGRHLVNSSLLGANLATMGAFVTMAPGAPLVAAGCLAANTVLSFLKGFTTTSAIGGADMRALYFRFCYSLKDERRRC